MSHTEAYQRIFEPPEIQGMSMVAIASVGLAVNLIALRLLNKYSKEGSGGEESLNMLARPYCYIFIKENADADCNHVICGLADKLLSKPGYPDMKITYKEKVAYLEMKTTSTASTSRLRTFYYTGRKKLNTSTHHLLLLILASPAGTDYWKIDSLTLSDLSGLSVTLKPEFNASKTDLMNMFCAGKAMLRERPRD